MQRIEGIRRAAHRDRQHLGLTARAFARCRLVQHFANHVTMRRGYELELVLQLNLTAQCFDLGAQKQRSTPAPSPRARKPERQIEQLMLRILDLCAQHLRVLLALTFERQHLFKRRALRTRIILVKQRNQAFFIAFDLLLCRKPGQLGHRTGKQDFWLPSLPVPDK